MMIKVERGNPTPEELAVVVALVQARAAAAADRPGGGPRPLDEWADPARNIPNRALRPGPTAWRATYWPH